MRINFLSNDDIFISYSRADGGAYVTGLADRLQTLGFSCFNDKLGTDADEQVPESLLLKISSCKMLVLLGTAAAVKSDAVAKEVNAFAQANGTTRIVPLSFDKGLPAADWKEAGWHARVVGLTRESEAPEALEQGQPSDTAVRRIENQFKYARSKERLQKYIRRAVAVFVVLALASVVAFGVAVREAGQVSESRNEITRAQGEAAAARTSADEIKCQADKEIQDALKSVEDTKTQAEKEIKTAQDRVATAQTQVQAAEQKRLLAELKSRQAERQAQRQETVAQSLDLATQSMRELKRGPEFLAQGAADAVKSVKRASDAGARLREPNLALRESLALLPHRREPEGPQEVGGNQHKDYEISFSPDGR